jgi:thioredoxin-related protein
MQRLALALAATVLLAGLPARAQDNGGLHAVPWFAVTFKDIAEDIAGASEQGKRLAIFIEQAGCSYCREIHEKVLPDPEVEAYLRENFVIYQVNMYGDEEVTDLDGTSLSEKEAVRRWGVMFTPTILFLPEEAPEGATAAEAAVATMPGAFRKGTFLDFFHWVRVKGYETDEPFQRFHARMIEERQAATAKTGTAN